MVHASACLQNNQVHLFLGASGTGKSTMAGLLAKHGGVEILSFDRQVIRPAKNGFDIFGTPWQMETTKALTDSGKLASLHFLKKANQSRTEELNPIIASQELFRVCFMAGWPRTDLDFILQMCTEICTTTPCYQLFFAPDESAVNAARIDKP